MYSRFFIVKEGFLLYYPEEYAKVFEHLPHFNNHPKVSRRLLFYVGTLKLDSSCHARSLLLFAGSHPSRRVQGRRVRVRGSEIRHPNHPGDFQGGAAHIFLPARGGRNTYVRAMIYHI